MITTKELRRLAHILDLFHKARHPGEMKPYPAGFNPMLCINNSTLYDPGCLLEKPKWGKIVQNETLKYVLMSLIPNIRDFGSYPAIYTRDPQHDYEVIGYYHPMERIYTRYKIQSPKHVLNLLNIKKNKPRGFYLLAKYPDECFLENKEIQENLENYIKEVQLAFPQSIYFEEMLRILPIKHEAHLRRIK